MQESIKFHFSLFKVLLAELEQKAPDFTLLKAMKAPLLIFSLAWNLSPPLAPSSSLFG